VFSNRPNLLDASVTWVEQRNTAKSDEIEKNQEVKFGLFSSEGSQTRENKIFVMINKLHQKPLYFVFFL
jgi:hypothetical protein